MQSVFCLLLFVTVVVADTDVCAPYFKGCTSPPGVPYFYKRRFSRSCYRHNACLSCGSLVGLSKNDCDVTFRINMMSECGYLRKRRDLDRTKRHTCAKAVETFYAFVHGSSSMSPNPLPHCSYWFVRSLCLPRN